jgi:phospholipid transport system substrate-binding protein
VNHGLSRRQFLTATVCAALPFGAWAQDTAAIRKPIVELYAALDSLMRTGQATPFPDRFRTLAPVIDRVYDLTTVLHVSVGLSWPKFDDATRAALTDAFRAFTIASFVANFDKFEGEKFEVLPDTRVVGTDQVVQTRIVSETGEPIRLDYVMQPSDAGWRVTDVLLDGTISRVAVQRSDFRALLSHGSAESLIASLRRKVKNLSGGTIGA